MEDSLVEGVADDSTGSVLESSQVQQVIGFLLAPKSNNCQDPVPQTDFPLPVKTEEQSVVSVANMSVATESPLDVSHVTLAGADILLANGDAVEHSLETSGAAGHLEDDHSAFVQSIVVEEESDATEAVAKFIDGQAVQLEDGSTAFIHTAPREGLQAVQLEDGTMAYLSHTGAELFNGEASGLELEQLPSPQLPVEMTEDKSSNSIKVSVGVVENTSSLVNSSAKSTAVNEKAFRCPYEGCFRLYTTLHHLKVHERSHTGDRPFPCTNPGCPKAFATAYGLKSHTRVHTGETPYRCPESNCSKAFKTSGDLQKHVRTHTGERPFKCPFNGCDRAFTTSNIRKVHIRTHTGERPYVCKEDGCNRAFASATNFKNHIRIHTGEKPYVCTIDGCNKRFTEYSSLYKHNVVHTHSKPYVCNLCSKTYRQTSTLAMHKRTVHGIVENGEDNSMDRSSVDNGEPVGKGDVFDDSQENNRIEFQLGTDINDDGNIVIQSVGDAHSPPVYTVSVQQDIGLPTSTHQILVVTDPSQLAALQQISLQVQLEEVLSKSGGEIVTPE